MAFAEPAAPTAAFWAPKVDPPNVAPPPNGLLVGAALPPKVVPPPKGDGDAAAGWPNGVEAGAAPPPKGEAVGAPGCPKGLAAAEGADCPNGLAAAAAG